MQHPTKNAYAYCNVPEPKWIIIFVHWLTSSKDEEMFIQAEKLFSENWYSTIRFNLYWDLPWEKKLSEVSLQDHINDVNEVINYYKSEWYKKIFLAGHSYWWIVNLYVNKEDISGILMWDSSIWWKWLLEDVHEDENWKYYIDWWNWYRFYISKKLYDDFLIPSEEYLEKIAEIKLPIKIIAAENWLSKAGERYYEAANEPKELYIVKWAYHRFEDWWMDELLNESLKWIDNN